jgi:hypothetical protein
VRAQNYRHLHFTLTVILMISNIYDIYKKNKIYIEQFKDPKNVPTGVIRRQFERQTRKFTTEQELPCTY